MQSKASHLFRIRCIWHLICSSLTTVPTTIMRLNRRSQESAPEDVLQSYALLDAGDVKPRIGPTNLHPTKYLLSPSNNSNNHEVHYQLFAFGALQTMHMFVLCSNLQGDRPSQLRQKAIRTSVPVVGHPVALIMMVEEFWTVS